MKEHNYIQIFIVPHTSAREWTFKVSYRTLKLLGGCLIGIFILFFTSMLGFGFIYIKALKTPYLMRRLSMLEEEQKKLRKFEKELKEIRGINAKVRTMLGMEKTPPPIEINRLQTKSGISISETESLDFLNIQFSEIEALVNAEREKQANQASIWPVKGFVSQEFVYGKHSGMDISGEEGDPVVAVADGIVSFAGWDSILGNMVKVEHAGKITSIYGHNSKLNVKVGEIVKQGQVISFLGTTGRSTAPHLHYEVQIDGKPVDPRRYAIK